MIHSLCRIFIGSCSALLDLRCQWSLLSFTKAYKVLGPFYAVVAMSSAENSQIVIGGYVSARASLTTHDAAKIDHKINRESLKCSSLLSKRAKKNNS